MPLTTFSMRCGGAEVNRPRELRLLPAILAGPTFILMALARFGERFLAAGGPSEWDELPCVLRAAYLALWVPGVGRHLGRPIHAALATHVRAPRNLDPPSPPG